MPDQEPKVILPAPSGAEQVVPQWRKHLDANALSDFATLALDESVATEQRFVEIARQRNQQQIADGEAAYRAASAATSNRQHVLECTDAELRQELLDAILNFDNALMALGIAEGNTARAKQRIDQADAELDDYADLNDRIVAWHTDQAIRDRHDNLPYALASAQAARGMVIDRMDGSHKAYQRLVKEQALAAQALAQAATERDRCAMLVIQKSTDSIAAQLETAMRTVTMLRQQLRSASSVWLPGANGPLPLSQAAKYSLRPPVEPKTDAALQTAYRTWFNALRQDADAELTL